ncbi:von Willebrand factor type A domain-containing protein [Candidatus Poribacteria bacterium]|nr:von Willebrand factor type A domain-containing protein [Candidatus Poribacteria bacterium]
MNAKRISGALMVSLLLHCIIMLVASIFYAARTAQFRQPEGLKGLPSEPPLVPQVRTSVITPIIKPVVKPTVQISRTVVVEQVQVQPRSTTHAIVRPTSAGHPQTMVEFSNKVVKMDSAIPPQLNSPNGVRPASSVQRESSPVRAPEAAKIGAVSAGYATSYYHFGLNPPNGEAYHDMYFKGTGTNPFVDTEDDHLSTFGMDVDTASYSIARRYVTELYLPPPEAIRVEEFINAFDYNYDPPMEDAFAIHIDGAPSKFGEGKRLQLLRIGLQGRVIPAEQRKDAILTFVIDVSGSMEKENRLELVKKALTLLVDQLRSTDKVGIVVYGSHGRLVLPHTGIEQRGTILSAIHALKPGGSTNAEEGLQIGYNLAWRNASVNHINRVILCSDGVANVGRTGPDEILKEIRTYVDKGITLSTVGFGMGNYNDVLMERLADTGNGSYAYIDTLAEAKRIFVENLTGTLQLIAKDAKIQVDFNPEVVSRFRLLGYENRRLDHEQFRDDTADAGEVGSGHRVTALYEVKLHPDATGKMATVSIRYADADNHQVNEVSKDISVLQLHESFDAAPATFRLAAAVAEFAEILRESYWAKDGSLDTVHQVVKDAFPEIDSEQVIELMYLVNKAIRYKAEQS